MKIGVFPTNGIMQKCLLIVYSIIAGIGQKGFSKNYYINYVKQVKHMSGLSGYPTFKQINVTAVIDSDLRFISLRFDEAYTVMYAGVAANCTGYVNLAFSY